jgi:hypothetical protein
MNIYGWRATGGALAARLKPIYAALALYGRRLSPKRQLHHQAALGWPT